MVQCPISLLQLSAAAAAASGLLLWAQWAGGIDRLLHGWCPAANSCSADWSPAKTSSVAVYSCHRRLKDLSILYNCQQSQTSDDVISETWHKYNVFLLVGWTTGRASGL